MGGLLYSAINQGAVYGATSATQAIYSNVAIFFFPDVISTGSWIPVMGWHKVVQGLEVFTKFIVLLKGEGQDPKKKITASASFYTRAL